MKKYKWLVSYDYWLKADNEDIKIWMNDSIMFKSEEDHLENIDIHMMKYEINENIGTENESRIRKVYLLGEIE